MFLSHQFLIPFFNLLTFLCLLQLKIIKIIIPEKSFIKIPEKYKTYIIIHCCIFINFTYIFFRLLFLSTYVCMLSFLISAKIFTTNIPYVFSIKKSNHLIILTTNTTHLFIFYYPFIFFLNVQ